MTRCKRRATQSETMQELIAEVRALRAEVAMLHAERVQIVPMPYPQPYPVYPPPAPWAPIYPWNMPNVVYGVTTIISTDLTSGSGATTILPYNVGG